VEYNKGCLGEFETAFDGELEAIANIMKYVIDNGILCDLTIHSDAQAAIARVGYTGTGPGKGQAIRVVKAAQERHQRGWRIRIDWVPVIQGLQEMSEQIGLLVKQHPTSKKDEPLLPGLKSEFPNTMQWPKI
jgi:hypothetical protein